MSIRRVLGGLRTRLLNLYTMRAAIVAAVVSFASYIPPEAFNVLRSIADEIGLGYRAKLVLAIFGGGYAMHDLVRSRRKAIPEAGPDYSWISGK